jgi:hypothetical protein
LDGGLKNSREKIKSSYEIAGALKDTQSMI